MIAGRIWAGELRVTAPITPDQDFEFISNVVQEAIYFDFFGEHPEHGDEIDLTVGLCDQPVVEGGRAVMNFPAVMIVFNADLVVVDVLDQIAEIVRETINGWYERPENYIVCFAANGECGELLG